MSRINQQVRQQAINTINQNIVVSASAGAGKTTLLIDRLIKRIVVDRLAVDQILALTFTEAAAAEMKERLMIALRKQSEQESDAFIQKQLTLLETAQLSTIHSFCLSIIKDYLYVLNLDPKRVNNILDDASKNTYQQECLDQVINHAIVVHKQAIFDTMLHFSTRVNDAKQIKDVILAIHKVRDAQLDPNEWDKKVLANYTNKESFLDFDPLLQQLILQRLVTLSKLSLQHAEACHMIARSLEHDHELILEQIIDHINQAIHAIKHKDIDEFNLSWFKAANLSFTTIKKQEEFNYYRDELYKSYEKVVPLLFDNKQLCEDISNQRPIIETLLLLTQQFSLAYNQIKEKAQVLDFDDMERLAYQILTKPDVDVAQTYINRFEEIMVDEFQDTSTLQDAIIRLVSKGNNIFRVGDVKQSIYRFRNAKPELMQQMMVDKQNKLVHLSNNFRSKKSIVDFNNALFEQLLNIEGLNNHYAKADWVDIGSDSQLEPSFPVELLMVDAPDQEDEEMGEESIYQPEDDELEFDEQTDPTPEEKVHVSIQKAKVIARKIIELHQNHDVAFSDICILVRSHQIKQHIRDVFDQANIPCFIDTKSGFKKSHTIQDVLSVLRWVIDPHDDLSLIGILQSPLFQFTQDQLAQLAIEKNTTQQSWIDVLTKHYPTTIDSLLNLKAIILKQSLADALMSIYDFNDYYLIHQDQQGKTNLDYLLEKATHYQQQGSLLSFLKIMDKTQDEVSSEAHSIGPKDDVVKVMTIHQSKGLQFPVVFYWSSQSSKDIEGVKSIMVDDQLGIGLHTILMPLRLKRTSLIRLAMQQKSQIEEAQEQLRVLYVALTRAQTRMFIVASPCNKCTTEPINELNIFRNTGTLGWLYPFFVNDRKTQHIIRNLLPEFTPSPKIAPPKTTMPIVKKQPGLYNNIDQDLMIPKTLTLSMDLKPTQQGSLIHACLGLLIKNGWQLSAIDPFIQQLDAINQQQIQAFVDHPQTQLLKNKDAFVEFAILSKQDHLVKQNYLDLLVLMENEWWIIDFKTDTSITSEQLINRYTPQIQHYKTLLQKSKPDQQIKTFLYSLTLSQYIQIQ